jgi:hypothetical protein
MNNEVNNNVNENPMPEWSLMMFWEDITALIAKIIDIIKGLF